MIAVGVQSEIFKNLADGTAPLPLADKAGPNFCVGTVSEEAGGTRPVEIAQSAGLPSDNGRIEWLVPEIVAEDNGPKKGDCRTLAYESELRRHRQWRRIPSSQSLMLASAE